MTRIDTPIGEAKKQKKIYKETVLVNGQAIHYQYLGQGDPLVFIHGLAASSLWWARNISVIAKQYRVYLIDLPGFGNMRHAHTQFSIPNSIIYIHRWMQAIRLRSAHMVGHSLGGYICMALASYYPTTIKSLTLVDTVGIPMHRTVPQMLWPLSKSVMGATPRSWPMLAYDCWRTDPSTFWQAAQQIVALDATSIIAATTAPTLLVWGKHDDLVPLANGIKMHALIKGSRLVILPKASHVSMYDQPAQFNAALLAFLNKESNQRRE